MLSFFLSMSTADDYYFLFCFIDRHLSLIFYYFFLYTVFVYKFRPQESQGDVLGDLRRKISSVVASYIWHASSALAGT
jgi:hypothetical protein